MQVKMWKTNIPHVTSTRKKMWSHGGERSNATFYHKYIEFPQRGPLKPIYMDIEFTQSLLLKNYTGVRRKVPTVKASVDHECLCKIHEKPSDG